MSDHRMTEAKAAINAVFNERDVDLETAIERQEDLAAEIEGNIDALNDDIRERDEPVAGDPADG